MLKRIALIALLCFIRAFADTTVNIEPVAAGANIDFHVATNGKDENAGTADAPFANGERAMPCANSEPRAQQTL